MADSPKSQNPKDPRFRYFRQATYGLYLVVTVGFCGSLIWQVYRSTHAMTYGTKAHAVGAASPVPECVDGAEGLFKELEARRQQLPVPPPAVSADQRWLDFRREWIERFRDLEARCALGSTDREPLAELFKMLEKVADLYTTHAVQYAGHVGPGADELAMRFDELRKSPQQRP